MAELRAGIDANVRGAETDRRKLLARADGILSRPRYSQGDHETLLSVMSQRQGCHSTPGADVNFH